MAPGEVCYDHRGMPRNSECLAWGPGGRDILKSTKIIGERQYLAARRGPKRGVFNCFQVFSL